MQCVITCQRSATLLPLAISCSAVCIVGCMLQPLSISGKARSLISQDHFLGLMLRLLDISTKSRLPCQSESFCQELTNPTMIWPPRSGCRMIGKQAQVITAFSTRPAKSVPSEIGYS